MVLRKIFLNRVIFSTNMALLIQEKAIAFKMPLKNVLYNTVMHMLP